MGSCSVATAMGKKANDPPAGKHGAVASSSDRWADPLRHCSTEAFPSTRRALLSQAVSGHNPLRKRFRGLSLVIKVNAIK